MWNVFVVFPGNRILPVTWSNGYVLGSDNVDPVGLDDKALTNAMKAISERYKTLSWFSVVKVR